MRLGVRVGLMVACAFRCECEFGWWGMRLGVRFVRTVGCAFGCECWLGRGVVYSGESVGLDGGVCVWV